MKSYAVIPVTCGYTEFTMNVPAKLPSVWSCHPRFTSKERIIHIRETGHNTLQLQSNSQASPFIWIKRQNLAQYCKCYSLYKLCRHRGRPIRVHPSLQCRVGNMLRPHLLFFLGVAPSLKGGWMDVELKSNKEATSARVILQLQEK